MSLIIIIIIIIIISYNGREWQKHLSLNHMSLAQCTMPFPFPQAQSTQCWNWPERTRRGGGVSCRNVRNLAQGLKFKADFHSKMSVCRHKLGGWVQPPDNSNPESTSRVQYRKNTRNTSKRHENPRQGHTVLLSSPDWLFSVSLYFVVFSQVWLLVHICL